jgi:DNA-binding NarL/FixJ family response regulator
VKKKPSRSARLARLREMPVRVESPAAQISKKNRVLIIDDHVMVREGVAEIIKHEPDLDVCGTATTANEGIEAVGKLKPDLVLVDITLPGKNGIEFIKDARTMQPNLRILVMSMHDESLYADRVLRAGGRGYIRKQEGGDKLIDAMRRVLQGQIVVSEKMTGKLLETFSGRKTMDSPLEGLSDRELEVFQLIGQGKTMKEIGDELHLSPKTVEVHRSRIREKLKIASAAELISYAARWSETQA